MVLLNAQHIFIEPPIETKETALQFLAKTAQTLQLATNDSTVLASFNDRELQGSTGMMDGFAIPHAKNFAIKEASILIVKINNPIEWDSLDGKPIEVIIALLIPEKEAGTTHLNYYQKSHGY